MKNQLVVLEIVLLFVCVGLSGCNQNTNSGADIKMINLYNSELNVTVNITGDHWVDMHWNKSQEVKSNTVYVNIPAGGEKSVHFDNLRMDFKNENGVVTQVMTEIFAQRKSFKNKMLDKGKELSELKEELAELEKEYYN